MQAGAGKSNESVYEEREMTDFFAYYMLVGMVLQCVALVKEKGILDNMVLVHLTCMPAFVKVIYWIVFPLFIWYAAALWPLIEYNSAKKKWGKTND